MIWYHHQKQQKKKKKKKKKKKRNEIEHNSISVNMLKKIFKDKRIQSQKSGTERVQMQTPRNHMQNFMQLKTSVEF